MADTKRGVSLSPAHRQAISDALGRPETRARVSAARLGKHHSFKLRQAISEGVRRFYRTRSAPPPPKPTPALSDGVVTFVFHCGRYTSAGEAWVLLDGATDEIYVSYVRSKLDLGEGDRVSVKLTKKLMGDGKIVQVLSRSGYRPSRQSSETDKYVGPLRSCGKYHAFCAVCRPELAREMREKCALTR